MPSYTFPPAPENARANDIDIKTVVRVINNIQQGKLNCTLDVSLNTAGATTVLTDPRLAGQSFLDLMPLSALAATDKAAIWYSAQGKGTVTINHPVNAGARNYRLVIIA